MSSMPYTTAAKAQEISKKVSEQSTSEVKASLGGAGITSETYEVMFDGEFTVTTATEQGYISPHARATITGRISKQYSYRVTVNGTSYIIPSELYSAGITGSGKCVEYLGKITLYTSDISGHLNPVRDVPFLIISDLNNQSAIDVFTPVEGTYTILIEKITKNGKTLPNYLMYDDEYNPIRFKENNGTFCGVSIGGPNLLKGTRGTIALGDGNDCSGDWSIAVGRINISSSTCSYAEGCGNTASGQYSHAEGFRFTTASGVVSHAEGQSTTASGAMSHSGGNGSIASGRVSFAQGNYVTASGACQAAVGYGNNPQTDSIFEVGNGLDSSGQPAVGSATPTTRQNAFRVTQGGVAIAQTGLQIGNTTLSEQDLMALLALIHNNTEE